MTRAAEWVVRTFVLMIFYYAVVVALAMILRSA